MVSVTKEEMFVSPDLSESLISFPDAYLSSVAVESCSAPTRFTAVGFMFESSFVSADRYSIARMLLGVDIIVA